METYNKSATMSVEITQSHVDRMNTLLLMKGEQPAAKVLCVVFPFLMTGINAFISLITSMWVKLALKIVVRALGKLQKVICPPETEVINPLEIT
jgi:hypothetical protein